MKKGRYFRLMLGLAILVIVCGFVTVFNPSAFWRFLNILLGISLLFSGISAIINSIKNQKIPSVWLLFAIGALITILGFMLIFSRETNFIGKLMIWMFALWAFMRGIMLIFNGLQIKGNQTFRWAITLLGGILVILAIATAISSAKAAKLAGICIGISIIFDGLSLLFFALRGNSQTVQVQILNQASTQEIGQGDVVISETVVISEDLSKESENKN